MKSSITKSTQIFIFTVILSLLSVGLHAQQSKKQDEIDKKVTSFLEGKESEWRYWNVPLKDGKVLFDIIVKNQYKSALEIGTSTGHSTIWLAWAMSKTGGKVITIEIDEDRHKTALENIKKAGLSEFVDARLADAHKLVKEIDGSFDFVVSDADKGWYTQYFKDTDPKLKVGGCFTAHNVSNSYGGAGEFVKYIEKQPNYKTTIDTSSSSGISISYKKSE
ncbi:MAG: class I SAM-dependent methyltransferase [Cyclobacteriaceae bacterium]|nr:class I SAM-dependent methyltransferase [Cyclobacteriaceae bacterium]